MFFAALIVSAAVTPLVMKLAIKIGAIDVPEDDRRVHKFPVPLIGGLAIYLSFIISVIIFIPQNSQILNNQVMGIIFGSTFITLAGLIDDIKPLRARNKFILQIIAATILVLFDVRIEFLTNPFSKINNMIDIGWLSIPATLFWIVGVTNAFNFIDGLDGLAAGEAVISCATLFIISMMNGREPAMLLTAAVAGGALGFLPYNFHPAKIFMGDTGSQFLGFVLAAISIQGAIKSATAIAVAVPVLALGLPIYDTLISMIRRYINNRPVSEADKGHLHHRLLELGLNQKQAVLIMYTISGVLGICAILAAKLGGLISMLILIIVLGFVLFFAKRLGLFKKKKSDEG